MSYHIVPPSPGQQPPVMQPTAVGDDGSPNLLTWALIGGIAWFLWKRSQGRGFTTASGEKAGYGVYSDGEKILGSWYWTKKDAQDALERYRDGLISGGGADLVPPRMKVQRMED